jgi:hypothetical protein
MTRKQDNKPALSERVTALEAENERRLDEIRRLMSIVQSQSETLQMLVRNVGDDR